jgi:WD40 repeat protein
LLGIRVTASSLLPSVIVMGTLVMTYIACFLPSETNCQISLIWTGFWDIDKLDDKHQGVRAFKVHNQPINCITFDKFNSTRLLTTSYDGYVRCLDLHSNVFDEVIYLK